MPKKNIPHKCNLTHPVKNTDGTYHCRGCNKDLTVKILKKRKWVMKPVFWLIVVGIFIPVLSNASLIDYDPCGLESVICENEIIAEVSAYNTVASQCDETPCMAAGGNICGRTDVMACPRSIPLHTKIKMLGKTYECIDRMNARYVNRFDLSFDKDIKSAKEWGVKILSLEIIK